MREITVKLYQFDELSEKAKEKALEHFRDINVDYDWWDCTYDELLGVGVDVRSFDVYHRTIDLRFTHCAQTVWDDIVKEEWGCEIGELAKELKAKYDAFLETQPYSEYWSLKEAEEKKREWFDEVLGEFECEMEDELIRRLEPLILKSLKEEYEYRTSDEFVTEAIEANEFEFYEDGGFVSRV